MKLRRKLPKIEVPVIDRFTGPHAYLSNFYDSPLVYVGQDFPTAEHAFQWDKLLKVPDRTKVQRAATPGAAKKLGRKYPMRGDWESVKFGVMNQIVYAKFDQHRDLGEELIATRNALLIEGNDWHDLTWGVCLCDRHNGAGHNGLGNILMSVRAELSILNLHNN